MIEYKFEGQPWFTSVKLDSRKAKAKLFFDYKIRINDVVFESNTPEFRDAYDKEKSWQVLRGNNNVN